MSERNFTPICKSQQKIPEVGAPQLKKKQIQQFAGSLLTKYSCLGIEFSAIYEYIFLYFFIFIITITNNTFDFSILVDKTIWFYPLFIIIIIIITIIYSRLLGVTWWSSGKSRSHQNQSIYPSILRMMCALLISVIFCSCKTDGSPGSN